jgi:hypothetical protein
MAFVTAESPAASDSGQHAPVAPLAPVAQGLFDRLERASIAEDRDGCVTVRRGRPAGCFLFGPYWRLPTGHYRLRFRCTARRPLLPGEPVLGVEIIALNRYQRAWQDFTAEELAAETTALAFTVPPELGAGDEERFEFRFFHLGNADLALAAVALEAAGAPAPPAVRRWRLFGRFRGRAEGGRGQRRAYARVRRRRRPGVVLALGPPYLQLPAGHYRLGFRGAARRPLLPDEPVLGVEIAARHRWHLRPQQGRIAGLVRPARSELPLAWRDFTAAELAGAAAAIDIVVPPELGLEAGDDTSFDIRFLHFGNAAWTISAVELQQASAPAEAFAAAGEWRLLGRLLRKGRHVPAGRGAAPRRLGPPRPPLALPAGRYRLSLAARLDRPRPAAAPVLQAAVFARPPDCGGRPAPSALRARQSFTAAELRAGQGAIAFSIPAELARAGGGQVACEFAFAELCDAAVAIERVVLRAVPPETVAAPALCRQARQKVVVVGNCQALTVYEALCRPGSLNSRVEAKYHFVGLQKNLHEEGRRELADADVLLVQEIRDWERYPLRDAVPETTPIVKFPLLHFASLWPFDHYNGPIDREAWEREWPNLTFLYLDGLLGRLRREIPDREQRFHAYRTLAVPGIVNYVRLHDFEKRRLVAMDRKYDCGIGRFILDNFQRRQLFYTTNHPNGQVLALLMRYVVRQLGIDEPYRPRRSLDHMSRLQVPVHPKIARALGVRWAHEKTRYAYGGRTVTWEGYIRSYIDHYG